MLINYGSLVDDTLKDRKKVILDVVNDHVFEELVEHE